MKTISDIIRPGPVWADPRHGVKTALVLMHGHHMDGLPVIEDGKVVGIVRFQDLVGVSENGRLSDLMDRRVLVAAPSLSVHEAADLMVRESVYHLPIVDIDGSLVGMLTAEDLVGVLRNPSDALTDLPSADSMRAWAIEQLRSGAEITVAFVDVNDFGQFNKRFSHTVGDAVLKRIADLLREVTIEERDYVCRYGGDEFCIATTRSLADSEAIGALVRQRMAALKIPEIGDERVSVSIGFHGGQRTREREHIHYEATLNSLIDLASRDCLARKQSVKRGPDSDLSRRSSARGPAGPPKTPEEIAEDLRGRSIADDDLQIDSGAQSDRLLLSRLEVLRFERKATVRVELQREVVGQPLWYAPGLPEARAMLAGECSDNAVRYASAITRNTDKDGLPSLVVEATVAALRCALPREYDVYIQEIVNGKTADERSLVTVVGYFVMPTGARPIAGSAFVGNDLHRAVAAAVLSATNSQVQQILAAQTAAS